MELYSDEDQDLSDCQATISFMKKVSSLIDAMMSRSPKNALRENSKEMSVSYMFKKKKIFILFSIIYILFQKYNILF